MAAEGWVAQLEKLFDDMHVLDDGKGVRLASLCLTVQVDLWWQIQKANGDVSTMTWFTFTQRFYVEYFLQSEMDSLGPDARQYIAERQC